MLQNSYKAMYRPNFYESTCLRCNETVYQVDRVGPLKDFTFFHSGCFKCAVCGTKLTLKTYYNNQHRQEDKEVYCNGHVPKIGPGHLDGSAVGIRSALNVPKSTNFVNEQIRGPGRGSLDGEDVLDTATLKGIRFESVEAVKEKATEVLNQLTEANFQHCFQLWKSRMEWFLNVRTHVNGSSHQPHSPPYGGDRHGSPQHYSPNYYQNSHHEGSPGYQYGRFDASALHIAHALKQTELQKSYKVSREKPIDCYL
ncbi:hypothetical protein NQ318_018935, partial [Aromia moschata]